MRRRSKETLTVALLFAAVATLFFGRSFFSDRLFVPMHTDEFQPWSAGATEESLADIKDHHFTTASDKLISFRADDAISLRLWRDGELPLWNPTNAGGVPHLGQGLYGVFYPFHAIFRIVSPERAYGILAALHHFLLALFTYLYVRRIGGGREGAVIAALGFSFSTCLLARAHYYQYLYTFTWLPLGLLLIDSWQRRGSTRALVWLAPVTSLVLLVAWPQTAAFTLTAWGVAVLARAIPKDLRPVPHRAIGMVAIAAAVAAASTNFVDPLLAMAFWPFLAALLVFAVGADKRAFARRLAQFGGVIALGGAVAALQYLPTAEWAPFGSRDRSAPEQLVERGMRPGFLAELILPGVFGSPDHDWTDNNANNLTRLLISEKSAIETGATPGQGNLLENAHYFGLLPLLLLPMGLLLRPRRRTGGRLFPVILTVLFGGFALGIPAIVYPAYFAGFVVGSDPRRALVPAVFALACLAGIGWRSLQRRPALGRWIFAVTAAVGAVTWVVFTRVSDTSLARPLLERWHDLAVWFDRPGELVPPEVLQSTVRNLRSEVVTAGAFLTLTGLLGFLVQRWRQQRFLRLALILSLIANLYVAAKPYVGTQPSARFLASHPMIDHLRATVGTTGRIARYDGQAGVDGPSVRRVPIPPNLAGHYGLLDAFCYTVSPPDRWMWLAQRSFFADKKPVRKQVGIYPLFEPTQLASRALDLMAVQAILGTGKIPKPLPDGIVLDRTFDDGAKWVLKNERALPRAFTVALVEDMAPYTPQQIVEERIPGASFDPRRRVLLEGEDLPADMDPATLPTAEIVSETPEELRIALAGGDGPGVLVNLDTFAPGWEAEIDGKEGRILLANFAFRGIPFPAGAKEIVLRYRPPSVRLGGAISIVALLVMIGVILRTFRSTRVTT